MSGNNVFHGNRLRTRYSASPLRVSRVEHLPRNGANYEFVLLPLPHLHT